MDEHKSKPPYGYDPAIDKHIKWRGAENIPMADENDRFDYDFFGEHNATVMPLGPPIQNVHRRTPDALGDKENATWVQCPRNGVHGQREHFLRYYLNMWPNDLSRADIRKHKRAFIRTLPDWLLRRHRMMYAMGVIIGAVFGACMALVFTL